MTDFPSVQSATADWGDYDNDGDLDLLLAGDKGYEERITVLYRNDVANTNTAPTLPLNLTLNHKGETTILEWDGATDAQTIPWGLTYNLRVGTAPKTGNIVSPMADDNGFRRIVQAGIINNNCSWTLKGLAPGTYYWSVQAIDTTLHGSAFAPEAQFTISQQTLYGGWVTDNGSTQSITQAFAKPCLDEKPTPTATPTPISSLPPLDTDKLYLPLVAH